MGSGAFRCESCGATWYSAAAHLLIEAQESCPHCKGGPLVAGDPDAEPAQGGEDEVRSGP